MQYKRQKDQIEQRNYVIRPNIKGKFTKNVLKNLFYIFTIF